MSITLAACSNGGNNTSGGNTNTPPPSQGGTSEPSQSGTSDTSQQGGGTTGVLCSDWYHRWDLTYFDESGNEILSFQVQRVPNDEMPFYLTDYLEIIESEYGVLPTSWTVICSDCGEDYQNPRTENSDNDPGNGGDAVVQNTRPYSKDYTLDFGDGIRIELGVTTLQDLYDFGFVFNSVNWPPDYDILTEYGPGGEMFIETEEEFIKIDVFLEDVHAPGAWPRPLDASEDKMVVSEYWAISMYAAGAVIGERLVIGQSVLEDAMAAYSHFELSGGEARKGLQHTESDGTRVQFWFSSFYDSDEELLDSVRILSPHR